LRTILLIFGISLTILCDLLFYSQPANAQVEWKAIKELKLEAAPIDTASSTDGQWIFILASGDVLLYSVPEDKVKDRIPVDSTFDRLTYSSHDNTLILSSSSEKTLKIMQIEINKKIDISGLPFKGPENAPITIAVFSDYQ
jgi:hypothetical protein